MESVRDPTAAPSLTDLLWARLSRRRRIRDAVRLLICLEAALILLLTALVCAVIRFYPALCPAAKATAAASEERGEDPAITPVRAAKDTEVSDPAGDPPPEEETVPAGTLPIRPVTLACRENGVRLFQNHTSYQPSEAAAVTVAHRAAARPTVLILHTHGTEAYSDNGRYYRPADAELARSEDPADGVVGVGDVLTEALTEAGFSVIHDRTMYDAESYLTAYPAAAAGIRDALATHPEITLMLDLHRDALIDADGTMYRTVCPDGDGSCAQITLLVGTDEGGADFDGWETNLRLALALQDELEANTPGITRPIDLRGASFNQQYAPNALLVEIGSSGNTAEEAASAALHLAEALGSLYGS